MIRAGAEGKLNRDMRAEIGTEATLNKPMRQEIRDEFVKTELERSAAALYRNQAEEENRKAEIEREAARTERMKAEERVAQQQERNQACIFRKDDEEWKEDQRWAALTKRIEGQNEVNFSLYSTILKERYPQTCQWLFSHSQFTAWTAQETTAPIFWLNGKHGAGKSFLCASAIDYVSGSLKPTGCFYHFFRKDAYISRNQLLRNIASQLIHCLYSRNPKIPPSLELYLKINKDDSISLEKLIRVALKELPSAYIFLDGLDEAEYTKEQAPISIHTANNEVNDFVSFLMECAVQHPTNVRLWCSSQPLYEWQSFFDRTSWKARTVQHAISLMDTANDIRRYLDHNVAESMADNNRDDFANLFFKAAMSTEVEGSFLWASSMLKDLKEQAEDTDDLIKLASEGLPSKMSAVYSQIMDRVKARDKSNKTLPLWK